MAPKDVTAQKLAEAARCGDETAAEVFRICGEYLGRDLSILIDLLNPEVIVLGSIFARCESLLRPAAEQVIQAETLPNSAACCRVCPAELGERIGDYAAVATAIL